jgi:plastocyanin
MRSFHLSRTARLSLFFVVAMLLGCGKSSDSTSPPPVTGPTWNFTFPTAGPNGTSHELVFTDIGTWNYQCIPHGSSQGMTGSVTVAAAGPDSVTGGVSIVNFAFNPSAVTIKQGGKVRWHNESNRTDHTSTR